MIQQDRLRAYLRLHLAEGIGAVLFGRLVEAFGDAEIPVLLDRGFWAMEDAARTDYSMFMSLLFLLAAGPGRWSVDRWITSRQAMGADGAGVWPGHAGPPKG